MQSYDQAWASVVLGDWAGFVSYNSVAPRLDGDVSPIFHNSFLRWPTQKRNLPGELLCWTSWSLLLAPSAQSLKSS